MSKIISNLILADRVILHFFQVVTNFYQKFFGKNCFSLAKIFTTLAPIPFISWAIFWSSKPPLYYIGMFLVAGLSSAVDLKIIDTIETLLQKKQDEGKPMLNPLSISDIRPRVTSIIVLLFATPLALSFDFVLWILLQFLAQYLMACTPPPPTAGKIFLWLKSTQDNFS
ncbi:MAG: hypothetical protein WCG01_05380, partial [bacterium]